MSSTYPRWQALLCHPGLSYNCASKHSAQMVTFIRSTTPLAHQNHACIFIAVQQLLTEVTLSAPLSRSASRLRWGGGRLGIVHKQAFSLVQRSADTDFLIAAAVDHGFRGIFGCP